MNAGIEPYLGKAMECIAGARSELANARYNNAVNRAYYAAYNAAVVALIRAGVRRPRCTHDEVQAVFAGQLVARRKLYPNDMRSVLHDLMEARLIGDYGQRTVSSATADAAVRRAETYLNRLLGTR